MPEKQETEVYNWECRLKDSKKWEPCTEREKINLSKPEFHGKFRFRKVQTGEPTKNSLAPKEEEKKKEKKKKTK